MNQSCLLRFGIDDLEVIFSFLSVWQTYKIFAAGDFKMRFMMKHGAVKLLDFRVPMACGHESAIDDSWDMPPPSFWLDFLYIREIIIDKATPETFDIPSHMESRIKSFTGCDVSARRFFWMLELFERLPNLSNFSVQCAPSTYHPMVWDSLPSTDCFKNIKSLRMDLNTTISLCELPVNLETLVIVLDMGLVGSSLYTMQQEFPKSLKSCTLKIVRFTSSNDLSTLCKSLPYTLTSLSIALCNNDTIVQDPFMDDLPSSLEILNINNRNCGPMVAIRWKDSLTIFKGLPPNLRRWTCFSQSTFSDSSFKILPQSLIHIDFERGFSQKLWSGIIYSNSNLRISRVLYSEMTTSDHIFMSMVKTFHDDHQPSSINYAGLIPIIFDGDHTQHPHSPDLSNCFVSLSCHMSHSSLITEFAPNLTKLGFSFFKPHPKAKDWNLWNILPKTLTHLRLDHFNSLSDEDIDLGSILPHLAILRIQSSHITSSTTAPEFKIGLYNIPDSIVELTLTGVVLNLYRIFENDMPNLKSCNLAEIWLHSSAMKDVVLSEIPVSPKVGSLSESGWSFQFSYITTLEAVAHPGESGLFSVVCRNNHVNFVSVCGVVCYKVGRTRMDGPKIYFYKRREVSSAQNSGRRGKRRLDNQHEHGYQNSNKKRSLQVISHP